MWSSRQQQQSQEQHTVWRDMIISLKDYFASIKVSTYLALAKNRLVQTIFLMQSSPPRLRPTLIQIGPFAPGTGQVFARPAAYIDGQPGLFRQGVRRADCFGRLHVSKCLLQPLLGESNGNHQIARRSARPPGSVLIVAADSLRQAITLAEVINRAGFPERVSQPRHLW